MAYFCKHTLEEIILKTISNKKKPKTEVIKTSYWDATKSNLKHVLKVFIDR